MVLQRTPTEAPLDNSNELQAVLDSSRELRSAILAGDHSRANQLVADYIEAVRVHWESMPHEERTVSTLPEETRALLLWAHQSTLIQKAMATDHLAILQKTKRYHRPERTPTLHVKA